MVTPPPLSTHPHAHTVTPFLTAVILDVKGLIVQTKDRVAKWIKK